jgi:thiamine-phosphate pyrophosphorylase
LKITLPKIYPITDRKLSGLSHSEQVAQFAAAGATLIQIREKHASSHEFYEEVVQTIAIARPRGVKIVVNDRVDIALLGGADGVHLGQDDLPPSAARNLLGDGAIIGVSTHTLEQARRTLSDGVADYIAFGPVFETATKADHEPVVSLERLAEIRREILGFPLVAIGGIGLANLKSVFEAGVDSAAIISEFYKSYGTIEHAFRQLTAAASNNNNVVTS